jgi:hypothetical protein
MGGQCFFIWRFIAIFLLLKNPSCQYNAGFSFKITKIRQQLFSGGRGRVEGVITFTPTGYSFKSSLKYCRQFDEICLNLSRDAHHPDAISKLKQKTLVGTFPKCEANVPYHLLVGSLL